MSSPDISSAEWIIEAPSECSEFAGCEQLPLTNMGTLRFSRASAIGAPGHRGASGNPLWSTTKIQLSDLPGQRRADAAPGLSALPSPVSASGRSFSISYQDRPFTPGEPPSTLPGAGAGAG